MERQSVYVGQVGGRAGVVLGQQKILKRRGGRKGGEGRLEPYNKNETPQNLTRFPILLRRCD